MQTYFIGVDGGGTQSLVRVENEQGELLGEYKGGAANIRLSVERAWENIHTGLAAIWHQLNLSSSQQNNILHVGMGLAGCEVKEAYQDFISHPHRFQTLIVTSDAHIACAGAHRGSDGAVIIAGPGVVGFEVEAGCTRKVGGWGFPFDDIGGGAWLGCEGIKYAVRCLDGRSADSELSKQIFAHFNDQHESLVTWANRANSSAFAEIAPLVIVSAQQGDPAAIDIMQRAAVAIVEINEALLRGRMNKQQASPCALMGGIAPFLQPYLNDTLQTRLRPPLCTPAEGAIFLVKGKISA